MNVQDIEKLKAEFGDREFTGSDIARVLGLSSYHGAGAKLKSLRHQKLVYATANGWRFGTPPTMPAEAPSAPPVAASEPVCIPPSVVKIGPLYIPETFTWLADTIETGRITLHTAILEIDPNTKHARNKRVTFRKDTEPREYAQLVAWLDSMAGAPPHVDDTALELAAELETKLNAANKEIAELKAKIDAIRGMFRGEL